MKLKLPIISLCLFSLFTTHAAALDVSKFLTQFHQSANLRSYAAGIITGFMFSSIRSETLSGQKLYCLPNDVIYDADFVFDLLASGVETHSNFADMNMIKALMVVIDYKYPCN
jgi:hypothetical protein